MRERFVILFTCLIIALCICALIAYRSRKTIGKQVSLLVFSLIPPVIGNLIIIWSGNRSLSTLGCYIYFLGMNLVMFSLLEFTNAYCRISGKAARYRIVLWIFLGLDTIQLLCNPFFGQAFGTEEMLVDGFAYYRVRPFIGQSFHRLVDYSIFAIVLLIFVMKTIRAPRVYAERYAVILLSMIFGGIWQTFYIFSRTPVDRSMIGFGIFGLLVFYFSLYYRPLRLLDRMLAGIASEMPEALFFYDEGGQCIWANQPAMKLVGLEKDDDMELATTRLKEMFGGNLQHEQEWCSRQTIGMGPDIRYFELERHNVQEDNESRTVGSFLSIRDLTEEQQLLQKEKYVLTHDKLTDLYTREYLYERIGGELRRQIKEGFQEPYLVVYVDVANFKMINDIFGSSFGDATLKLLADWIRRNVTESCVYGRLGGDTFGIYMPVSDFHEDRFKKDLEHFSVMDGNVEQEILIHLGVYEITDLCMDVSVMFDRAHLAQSTIKDEYQIYIAYYNDEMRRKVLWNQHISAQLQDALNTGQIRPFLQPIVDQDGRVIGAEALVRWIHPEDGFLSPVSFIPVFEKNGMITEVDRYMWRCACELLSKWKKEKRDLFISVNISPKDFYFMDVGAEIRKIVREYDVDPGRLRVEITETVMMTDIENRMKILQDLRKDGFYVEIDDFGSGYSSLNLLKDMPADVLKIDMKFLGQTQKEAEGKAQTILSNIITMSENLGIMSLTEGVETSEQYHMLYGMGCRMFQGYYFAKPMPVGEFEKICP